MIIYYMDIKNAKKYLGIKTNINDITKDVLKNNYKNKINMIKTGEYSYDDKLILLNYAKSAYKLLKDYKVDKSTKVINTNSYYESSNLNSSKIYINKNTYLLKTEKRINLNGKINIEKKYYIVENNKKREINENQYLKLSNQ